MLSTREAEDGKDKQKPQHNFSGNEADIVSRIYAVSTEKEESY